MPRAKKEEIKSKESKSERNDTLTITISKSHKRRLKVHAAMEDMSISEVIENWVDQYCKDF